MLLCNKKQIKEEESDPGNFNSSAGDLPAPCPWIDTWAGTDLDRLSHPRVDMIQEPNDLDVHVVR